MHTRSLVFPLLLAALLVPSVAQAAPLFTDATANLGSPQPCFDPANPNAEGCYTHYVVMADLEGDGDLDLLFAAGGGYYTPAGPAPFLAYLNDGSGHFQESSALFGGVKGRVRQVAVGDIDGDGDLDVYLPQGYGDQGDGIKDSLFLNDGQNPPHFSDEAAARLPITSRAGAVRLGDVDDDGDLDLLITDWGDSPPTSAGTGHVYLNDGHGFFQEKAGALPMDTAGKGTGPIDIDFFDADGDFDLDVILASRKGDSLLFLNDGKGTFTNVPLPGQPGPYVYGPDECDVDGDGDLDLWLDNGGAGHHTQLLINDGSGTFTDETAARVTGNPAADDNEVQCADLDGDGDFDAVIASLDNNERVLINDGTGHFTLAPGAFPAVSDSTLGLDLGDVDGDGRLDAVTAQGESGPFLNRLYLGVEPQPKDTRPPAFRAVQKLEDGVLPGKAVLHFAVFDNTTTDAGPRLHKASLSLGDGTMIPAHFSGGDLYRAELDLVAGKKVLYQACVTDWANNQACSAPIEVTPAGGSTGAGGSGTGGAGTTGATGTTGSGGSSGETGGSGSGGSSGGGGCACEAAGSAGAPWAAAAWLGLGLAALGRRARAGRRG
ncbi:MAG: VCBS repeat-containing protein [Byssovorax sp.]